MHRPTVGSQGGAFSYEPWTLNPKSKSRYMIPPAANHTGLSPHTLNRKPTTLNPDPKLATLNPQP
jgi:hypothetical protein